MADINGDVTTSQLAIPLEIEQSNFYRPQPVCFDLTGEDELDGVLDISLLTVAKKNLQHLNETFTDQVDKVRFLEAEKNRLVNRLLKLMSETTSSNSTYKAELEEVTQRLSVAESDKQRLVTELESVKKRLDEQKQRYKELYEKWSSEKDQFRQLTETNCSLKATVKMLRSVDTRRATECTNNRISIRELTEELDNTKEKLSKQSASVKAAHSTIESLKSHLEFIKRAHEKEIAELMILAKPSDDREIYEYWQKEMGLRQREMQQIHNSHVESICADYERKMDVLRRKIGEIDSLRRRNEKLETYVNSIRSLLKNNRNVNLQGEISTYSTLLSQLEAGGRFLRHNLTNGLDSRPMLELGSAPGEAVEIEERNDKLILGHELADQSQDQQSQESSGESTGKPVIQRSAKGPTTIAETSPEGRFVELENTGRKDEDLSGWLLKTNVDSDDRVSFKLPINFIVKPGDKIKIWANGAKPAEAGPRDLELEQDGWPSWASGREIITKLVNPANEDRATHTKKTK